MIRKTTSVDAYLALVKGEKRAALDKLRKTIRAVVPKAEECISYRIPAFPATLVRKLLKARIAEG